LKTALSFITHAPQSRGLSASLRRQAHRRAVRALAVGALLAGGPHPAAAGTFNYTGTGGSAASPVTGLFSTGFSPTIVSSGTTSLTTNADTLSFAGAAYNATDDITSVLTINALSFTNTGLVQLLRGAGTALTLGGTVSTITTGAGAVVNNLDLTPTNATVPLSFNIGAGGFVQNGALTDNYSTLSLNTGGATTGTLTLAGSSIANTYLVGFGTLLVDTGGVVTSRNYTDVGSVAGDSGTMTVQNTGQFIGLNVLNIADATGSSGTVNVSGTASVSATTEYVGRSGTAAGVVNQTGGTVASTATANDTLVLGGRTTADAAAVGIYNLSGAGSLVTVGSSMSVGLYGSGQFNMTGGTVNVAGSADVGHNAGGLGVLDVSGGVFSQNATGNPKLYIGDAGTGVVNVRGTGTIKAAGGVYIGNNATTGVGVLNLLSGGTLQTAFLGTNTGSSGTLNFNGGTVQSLAATGGNLMGSLTNVYIYGNGATIDTTGGSVGSYQVLKAPTGAGVGSIMATGSGFKTTPIVQITGGGGTGATAVATIDGSGTLTGFLITNPGVNYTTAPTVTLVGANGGTATATAVLNAGNVSGGLTKTGANTLTMTAASTYTGATTISGGTISTGTTGKIANGGVSSIGASTNAAGNLVLDGGTLQYANTGVAQSTDRLFTLTNNGGALDASGTNALSVAGVGAIAFTGSGARTLTLTGSNTGANTFAPTLGDGAGGATALTKAGAGAWFLTNASTYTGGTTVSGGTLTAGHDGALGSGTVTVVSGGSLTLQNGSANNYIGDLAKLILTSSNAATPFISLNFTGTDTVGGLSFDNGATFVPAGTYGSASSGAAFTNTDFTGAGTLTVLAAAPEPSQWAAFGLGMLGLGGLAIKARRRTPNG
jgi:fibronectin-binding autotransporter adhesin